MAKVYQLKKTSGLGLKVKPGKARKTRSFVSKVSEFPEIKPIQNIMPDSKEEYWVALALYKLGMTDRDFIFQYQALGYRGTSGTQIVDFLVFTPIKPTPLLVQGDYWHYTATRRYNTVLAIEELKRHYGQAWFDPVEILTSEIPTPDMTVQVVRQRLGL